MNAEKEIFGGKDEYICSCCGKSFENRRVYNNHSNNCSKKKVKAVEKANKLLSDFHIESEHYVYTLKIKRSDGEIFWYVGESNRIESRIVEHIEKKRVKYPNKSGNSQKDGDYSVLSVVELIPVDDRSEALKVESERAHELCLEYYTTNIMGGR